MTGVELLALLAAAEPIIKALEPAAVALFNVIKDAIEGKYKNHEAAVQALNDAYSDAMARIEELPGDIGKNNAQVDEELAAKFDTTDKPTS